VPIPTDVSLNPDDKVLINTGMQYPTSDVSPSHDKNMELGYRQ